MDSERNEKAVNTRRVITREWAAQFLLRYDRVTVAKRAADKEIRFPGTPTMNFEIKIKVFVCAGLYSNFIISTAGLDLK